jgi:predicted dehydrogenase
VKEFIDDGTVGDVQYISMMRTNLGPGGIDVNVAWDLATHDVSIANYWLGSSALRVSASGGRFISPDKEDTVFATLTYPGGRLVNLNVSWLNPRKQREIIVVGNRRMLTVDDMSIAEPIRIHDKGIVADRAREYVDTFEAFRASIRDGDIVIPHVATGEPLLCECEAFLDCIMTGTTPVNEARTAVSVVRTIEAINRSVAGRGCEEEV